MKYVCNINWSKSHIDFNPYPLDFIGSKFEFTSAIYEISSGVVMWAGYYLKCEHLHV